MKLLLAAFIAVGVLAQDAPKKKPAVKKPQQTAHGKATPEQIRKFNQLEKQQKK